MGTGSVASALPRRILFRAFSEGSLACILLLTILAARFLTVEDYGRFVFIYTIMRMASLIGEFGLVPVIVAEVAQHGGSSRRRFSAALLVQFVTTSASLLVALTYTHTRVGVDTFAVLLLVSGVFVALQRTGLGAIEGCSAFGIESVLLNLQRFGLLGLGIALLAAGEGLRALGVAFSLTAGVGCIAAIVLAMRLADLRLQAPALSDIVFVTRSALPFLATAGLWIVFHHIDILMLERMIGAESVARYGVAYKLYEIAPSLPVTVAAVLFPEVARRARMDPDSIVALQRTVLRSILPVAFFLAVWAQLYGSDLLATVYGPEYPDSHLAFQILAAAYPVLFLTLITSTVLAASGNQVVNVRATSAGLVVNIVLNLVLIPYYGFVGASVATVLTEALVAGIVALSVRSRIGPIGNVFSVPLLLAAFGTCTVGWLLLSSAWMAGSLISALSFAALFFFSKEWRVLVDPRSEQG